MFTFEEALKLHTAIQDGILWLNRLDRSKSRREEGGPEVEREDAGRSGVRAPGYAAGKQQASDPASPDTARLKKTEPIHSRICSKLPLHHLPEDRNFL